MVLGLAFASSTLIILSFVLGSFYEDDDPKRTSHSIHKTKSTQEDLSQVNQHLQATEFQRIIKQFKTELENRRAALGQNVNDNTDDFTHDEQIGRYGVQLDQEHSAADIDVYLERTSAKYYPKHTVRDRIESRIDQQKFLEEYDKKYETEFVNQFVNNMQEAGYEVIVNDKLEVVRVRKIPKPDSLLFE